MLMGKVGEEFTLALVTHEQLEHFTSFYLSRLRKKHIGDRWAVV